MSLVVPCNVCSMLTAFDKLNAGGCVAFPTETVYGLGVRSDESSAVVGLYALKERQRNKPLTCHYWSVRDVWKDAVKNEVAVALACKFWPGPMTLILRRSQNARVANEVFGGLDTISVRVTSNYVAQCLLRKIDVPVVATSANKSANVSSTTAQMVRDEFCDDDVLIIDGGETSLGIESTVIDAVDPSNVKILRLGAISVEDVQSVVNVEVAQNALGNAYKPRNHKLIINSVVCSEEDAFLDFGQRKTVRCRYYANLSASADLQEAASNFFRMMSELERTDCKNIVVAPIPDMGIGEAINDKLKKAASIQ